MKGYFSQLARQSGLRFQTGRTTVAAPDNSAAGHAPARADASPSPAATPLHVEEVAYISQPPSPASSLAADAGEMRARANSQAKDESTAPATPAAAPHEATRDEPEPRRASQPVVIQQTPAPGSPAASQRGAEDSRALSAHQFAHEAAHEETHLRFTTSEPSQSTSESALPSERTRAQELSDVFTSTVNAQRSEDVAPHVVEQVRTVEDLPHVESSSLVLINAPAAVERQGMQRRDEGAHRSISDASGSPVQSREEQLERARSFQDYLREVREWVSATPEADERAAIVEAEPQVVETDRRGVRTIAQTLEAARQNFAEREREREVQELNLSIGSISIVVEQPTQITQPLPAAQPTPERTASERAESGSTDLSRFYLRSW